MSTLETQYREYLRNNRGGFCSFEEWKEMHGNQIKQALIEMMEKDEELGLYDDIKINRIELVCKDCSDSLEDCTCIKDTVDFPKQEDEFCYYSGLPSPTAYSKEEIKLEEVFNDDKKENIKKFIDEINNPSQPNNKLKQASEKYSKYLEDFENKNTYEHGFKDGAKWQQETDRKYFHKYIKSEKDFQTEKMSKLGINTTGQCFEQMVTSLIIQQERSYSEEEVIQLVSDWTDYRMSEDTKSKVTFKKYLEQFKKK